jgi:hypothetical protein
MRNPIRYKVWYMKPEHFRTYIMGTEVPDPNRLSETHVYLKTIECGGPNAAFSIMQGENWSPNGEARELIEKKGLSHTSMSVGDVLEEVNSGKKIACASVGWKEI